MNWNDVGAELSRECPSGYLRSRAASLLGIAEGIGPLTGENRTHADEFKRVYRFITFNEPNRIEEVAQEILKATTERSKPPAIKANAWNYVVGVYDRWILQARVAYLVAGLLEGALRSRLNARLSDHFGEHWPSLPEAVPSAVRELQQKGREAQILAEVRRALDSAGSTTDTLSSIRTTIAVLPSDGQIGESFAQSLTFGNLRSFFQAKRLWSRGPRLVTVFDAGEGNPVMRSDVDENLRILHESRNSIAHYHPKTSPTFAETLYAAGRLARWLSVDLQHFYASVDTRYSTELSLLLDAQGTRTLQAGLAASNQCGFPSCASESQPEELVLMMDRSPVSANDLTATPVGLGCHLHRVIGRAARLRPGQ